jgi:hypothetical protein
MVAFTSSDYAQPGAISKIILFFFGKFKMNFCELTASFLRWVEAMMVPLLVE